MDRQWNISLRKDKIFVGYDLPACLYVQLVSDLATGSNQSNSEEYGDACANTLRMRRTWRAICSRKSTRLNKDELNRLSETRSSSSDEKVSPWEGNQQIQPKQSGVARAPHERANCGPYVHLFIEDDRSEFFVHCLDNSRAQCSAG
ncbi:hypothetical protein LINGRAHAP2_LOCUS22587 [Linum grandiflorum]